MPAEREPPTLADYAVTAISPVLIMLMVGSLVFFLVTVLPTGDYKERLLYTTFFFVFGAVLIARIAIQYDAASNVILLTAKDRFHDETATGDLGDPATTPKARVSYVAQYYDKANRPTDIVVENQGQTRRVRVVDVTRLAQLALYGLAMTAIIVGLIARRRISSSTT